MDSVFSKKIMLPLFVGVMLIALPAKAKIKGYFQCTNGQQEETTTVLPAETDIKEYFESTKEIKCFNSDLQKVTSGSYNFCQSENVTRKNGVCNLTCDNDLYPSPFNRAVCVAGSGENGGEWYPKNLSCRQIECTDWNEWSENEYKLIEGTSWDKALETCASNATHLVTIESKEEDEFVQKLVKKCNTRPTWIGLRFNETNGTWEWSDGTDTTFRNWGTSQPSSGRQNYCVSINLNKRKWFNEQCNSNKPAVCRRKR